MGSVILLSLAGSSAIVEAPVDHKTFATDIYTDHFENHLSHHLVASHNISYTSSVAVAMSEYGSHAKHCQFTFSSLTLSRRFSYDILRQTQPYGVRHMQFGTRTWVRAAPVSSGDVKGTCSTVLPKIISPAAATANTVGIWKDVIEQDDAVLRHFVERGSKRHG